MALAIRWDGQLRRGELKDCAAIARVGNVTRARVSQIMALLNLASDLQEAILFLEADRLRCGCVTERKMRDVCAMPSWERQRDALGPALTRTPAGGRASESAR
ncbi:MAG: hypothetical protein JNM94_15405 [Phycisphaerae bacterium]|nr:hypothetical protein [Phycisphaerae bacterium]